MATTTRKQTRHQLPDLPYHYDALEPHIDAKTMEIHHTKHHATYVSKLNEALEGHPDLQDRPLEQLLRDVKALDEKVATAVRNHGGGHHNHSLFWHTLKPRDSGQPGGELADGLNETFGSFADFQRQFEQAALDRFGSGWAWLWLDGGKLAIGSTPNQDSPLMDGRIPILGLDVWEHAYYLKYQNRRPDYVGAFWNVVDWDAVDQNLRRARREA